MNTKIVYVLVSDEFDYYYEMFLLSHYSLRIHHPKEDTDVALVMDVNTHQRLLDINAPILDDVTPIIVEIPREFTIMQRSRFLKTTLRQRIKGDFLYLDTDTIICESLEEIDQLDVEIAMVANEENGELPLKNKSTIAFCKNAGFHQLANEPFFNGGVAFVRDSPICYRLFEEWHHLWTQSVAKGVSQDQPALCQANVNVGYPIRQLMAKWNCPVFQSEVASSVDKAKVLHYYSSLSRGELGEMLFLHLREIDAPDAIVYHLAHSPRTIGYLFFSFNDIRIQQYKSFNMLNLYENNPPFFRMMAALSRLFERPVHWISAIKSIIKKPGVGGC